MTVGADGINRTQHEAERFDIRDFTAEGPITGAGGDLLDATLANGYRYQVLEPLMRIGMSCADPQRGNVIDVKATEARKSTMLPSNRHFGRP